MEEQGVRNTQHQSPVKVWTFRIQGGQEFSITLKGNPSVNHDGGRTLCKLVCSFEVAEQFIGLVKALGSSVEVFTEEESQEQTEERETLLTGKVR